MQQHPGGFVPPAQFPGSQPFGQAASTSAPARADPAAAALHTFWEGQQEEMQQVGTDIQEFKNHQLPLARIKKIMKSDEDVRMISAEAPVLFAKACEMFILELTIRSWGHAQDNKRRTLQRSDVAASIANTEILDFLLDIVPREDLPPQEDEAGGAAAQATGGAFMPEGGPGIEASALLAGGVVGVGLQQWGQDEGQGDDATQAAQHEAGQ